MNRHLPANQNQEFSVATAHWFAIWGQKSWKTCMCCSPTLCTGIWLSTHHTTLLIDCCMKQCWGLLPSVHRHLQSFKYSQFQVNAPAAVQSLVCMQTCLHIGWGWYLSCCMQTSKVCQKGPLRCNCWCRRSRPVGRSHVPQAASLNFHIFAYCFLSCRFGVVVGVFRCVVCMNWSWWGLSQGLIIFTVQHVEVDSQFSAVWVGCFLHLYVILTTLL